MALSKNNRFDYSLEVLTPEGVQFILSPAGLPVRTLAYAIDKIIQWVILAAISINGFFMQYTLGMWLTMILSFCIEWFYHIFFELTFRGKSPGKMITGIRVVKNDGAAVDPASSFLRNLLRFADTFFMLFPIALVSMLASSAYRRLGDLAGGTLVVYSETTPGKFSNCELDYEPISPPFPLPNEEKQAIMSFARRHLTFGEFRANEIAGIYAPFIRKENGVSQELDDTKYLLGIAGSYAGGR